MPHGMYDAIYLTHEGRSCSRLAVSDGNVQTRMNVVHPDRHRYKCIGLGLGLGLGYSDPPVVEHWANQM